LKDDLSTEIKKRVRNISDLQLSLHELSKKVNQVENKLHISNEGVINLGEVTGAILEILKVSDALSKQDEADKYSISLWGMQENTNHSDSLISKTFDGTSKPQNFSKLHKEIKNVVSIDKECYS